MSHSDETTMPQPAAAPPIAPRGAQFDLVSHWRLHAPLARVWDELADPGSWPAWWPHVQQVQTLRMGGADGLGALRRITWATRLPYRIVIEVETVEVVHRQRLRGRSRGQLEGEGLWLLREQDGCTDVTYVWRVRPRQRWMRWTAPLLAPLFRWNHDGVMRVGEAGLQRRLDAGALRGAGA